MGVKYRCDYKDNFDNQCRIDISNDDYAGAAILVRGVGGSACTIVRDCSDDPYDVLVNSKANINIYQDEDNSIDIQELQEAQDRDFRIVFYINSVIEFSGFLIPDGIQRTFQSAPFELNINATDGLKLLEGITYTNNNLTGGRCIINYLRQILFAESNLSLPLPIRWANTITNDEFPSEDDVFSGSVRWSPRGEGFTDYQGNDKSCLYILEGQLRSMQCRIVQSNGRWVIWRINDVVDGTFQMYETPATTSGFTITDLGTVDRNKSISRVGDTGDYSFISEDAILTSNPALKTVITKYNQDQRENVLPNGNMDIVDGIFNVPIYWQVTSSAVMESVPSLSDAVGSAVRITNDIGDPVSGFMLSDTYLPIDTDVLYDYINFGFKFSIEYGPNVDGDGIILWDETPFKIQVIYDPGTSPVNTYYLNEFGFWSTDYKEIDIRVDQLKLDDVAQVDFNRHQNIIMPLPNVTPIGQTNEPRLEVIFFVKPGWRISFDDIYVNVESNSDVYEAYMDNNNTGKEEYSLPISSAHSGFYVSSYMTNYDQSGVEKFFSDSHLTGATLTEMNSHAILRNRYKSSLVFEGSIYGGQYQYDEIYSIQTLTGKKFLPLRSSWNTETNVVNLAMVEVRDDGTGILMKHYGSNDKTLQSN